jgi:hypothetical protein
LYGFKAIGGFYGEFLDYDNSTASRSKLDVACLKISTKFRGNIDESVHIKALGVIYSLRVVEDKVMEYGFHHGERLEERDCSWVESVNYPAKERVGDGGEVGGGEDDETEGEEEVLHSVQVQVHGVSNLVDGDMSLVNEGKEQNLLLVSGGMLEQQNGKKEHIDKGSNTFAAGVSVNSGSQVQKLLVGNRDLERNEDLNRVIETCPLDKGVDSFRGPGKECANFDENQIRFILSEPTHKPNQHRSASLSPDRSFGLSPLKGRKKDDDLDFNDSISLVEVRRGVDSKQNNTNTNNDTAASIPINEVRRGRSRKPKDRSKISKQSRLGVPKFLQLEEALKEGGGRWKKRKQEAKKVETSDEENLSGSEDISCSDAEGGSISVVPDSTLGINLEVVLPGIPNTPGSGLELLQFQEGGDDGRSQIGKVDSGSAKLLQIQQQIGFRYNESDAEVIAVLEKDEQRDRSKKQEWEQSNGFQ